MFEFVRLVRTSASDRFVVFCRGKRCATVDVHYDKAIYLSIFVEQAARSLNVEKLKSAVERMVDVSGVEDLIVEIYRGKEIFSGSREYDWDGAPASRAEIKRLEGQLLKNTGRYENAVGNLIESIVVEYFNKNPFAANKADNLADAHKIDVIAEKNGEIFYIQCKAGNLSYKTILSYCNKMISYGFINNINPNIVFVAKSFPEEFVFGQKEISQRFGTTIKGINVSDILREIPRVEQAF